MQPVATEGGESAPHQRNAKPLGEVFVEFERFAESEFSSGTALAHIEKAIPPLSDIHPKEALENAALWRRRQRLSERPRLVKGLAVYLFDRFLTGTRDVGQRIFLRTPDGDNNVLGRLAVENTCAVPFEWIDFRNAPLEPAPNCSMHPGTCENAFAIWTRLSGKSRLPQLSPPRAKSPNSQMDGPS